MKKLSIFALIMLFVSACTKVDMADMVAQTDVNLPEAITLSIDDSEETRIQLKDERTSVWTKGDCVSVFAKSDANNKYQFNGSTGATTATFTLVSAGNGSATMNDTYVLYPYYEQNSVNTASGVITTTIPAKQDYLANSYGVGSSVMVGAGTDVSNILLKNVCGWFKIQLTGNGEEVESIMLAGNKGEAIAGTVMVNANDATVAACSYEQGAALKATLNCNGVKLSKKATAFYIAVAPQTFDEGINITIKCADGTKMLQSTYNKIDIKRNYIQPMAAIEYTKGSPANNEIWYVTNDGALLDLQDSDFDAKITSHTHEEICVNMLCMQMGVLKFDKDVTEIKSKAFQKFENLRQITLPNSIKTIGSMAFYECAILKTVQLGDNLKTIKSGAFGYCTGLSEITIPESVTSIESYAFSYCSNLKSVYVKAQTPPTLGSDMFYHYVGSTFTLIGTHIYVPSDAADTYKSAKNWSIYAKYIKRYDFENGVKLEADENEEGGEVSGPKFHHRILLVDHTGTWCGNCPRVMDGLVALAETDCHEHYNEVTCHGSSASDNAYSTAAYYLDAFHSPNGYPCVRFNFHGAEGNIGSVSSFVSSNSSIINSYTKNNSAAAGIAASSKIDGSNVKVELSVMAAIEQEYKVTAWVLENDVYNPYQSGATNSTYHIYHDHCLRAIGGAYSTSDMSGDSLGVIGVGKSKDYSFSIPLESKWDKANLEVLIIVSAKTGNRFDVVNTALCPINGSIDYHYAE